MGLQTEKAFGQRLKSIRKAQKITQVQLSERAGLSKSYISFLETGERHPSREVVLKLAAILLPPQDTQARDELLYLAGFRPEDPAYTPQFDIAEAPQEQSFKNYLQSMLNLIKTGELQIAQSRLEEGFQHFHKPAQMQTLLAHLELARGNYQHAIIAQQAAISQYDLQPVEQDKGLSLADFIFNLGEMYFIQGDSFLFKQFEPEERDKNKWIEQALASYHQACEKIEKALKMEPENIYFQEEYGRVLFNLADLSLPDSNYWEQTIAAFEKVFNHAEKSQLKPTVLRETGCFLAHAYSKAGQFEQAQLILNLLEAFAPSDWLLYYIRACYYSLYSQQTQDEMALVEGLKALAKAVEMEPETVKAQAQMDQAKDLFALCSQRPNIFKGIVE